MHGFHHKDTATRLHSLCLRYVVIRNVKEQCADIKLVIDICRMSLFCGVQMCRYCGREICAECDDEHRVCILFRISQRPTYTQNQVSNVPCAIEGKDHDFVLLEVFKERELEDALKILRQVQHT